MPLHTTEEGEEVERLRAEVKDLKARLKAARAWMLSVESESAWSREAKRATDLRVRDWRKP